MRYGYKRSSNKFNAVKSSSDGYSFGSKLERAVYEILKLQQAAGELKILKTQECIYLTDARILYKPDFTCEDSINGEVFWVEAKGLKTPVWAIKKRLWTAGYGPGKLIVYEGNHSRLFISETIISKNSSK